MIELWSWVQQLPCWCDLLFVVKIKCSFKEASKASQMHTTEKRENFQALRAYQNQCFLSKPPKISTIEFWLPQEASFAPPGGFSKIQVLPRRRQGGLMEGSQKIITGPGGPRAYKIWCFFDFFEKQTNHFFATLSAKNDPIWFPLEFFNNSRRHKGPPRELLRPSKSLKTGQKILRAVMWNNRDPPLRSSISYC